jgi:ATP-binding cassette subfamily B protein
MLRGDKGVRSESTVSNGTYFGRALSMAKGEGTLLFLSFTILALYCLSGLYLPNYQGKIIDRVVPDDSGEYDKSGFINDVKIYLFIMLAQGAFSTIYSAAFQLVSRRLVFNIRNTLFRKILVQDVAYFDGTESGRLISRLTNDVNMMMQPIQSSLSSLISNAFMLVGGLIFCYVKSYRLSMLAFVTVGPIMYLWDLYAQWSKRLNRQMLASWAEGNSIASQALSHIRTVKAFGTETSEIDAYNEANLEALKAGVKDAWGNGFTTALTSYLDLGTGVLILYYGGTLVMDGEMSVGELVTFQLYWNMMNNAYQNLQVSVLRLRIPFLYISFPALQIPRVLILTSSSTSFPPMLILLSSSSLLPLGLGVLLLPFIFLPPLPPGLSHLLHSLGCRSRESIQSLG